MIVVSIAIGSITSFVGTYASYFLDGATGGIIMTLQTLVFLIVLVVAPKHGILASRHKSRMALEQIDQENSDAAALSETAYSTTTDSRRAAFLRLANASTKPGHMNQKDSESIQPTKYRGRTPAKRVMGWIR